MEGRKLNEGERGGDPMTDSERKPTQKALQEMARAMVYFLSIGWRKQDLGMLEEIWWQVRDDQGRVKP